MKRVSLVAETVRLPCAGGAADRCEKLEQKRLAEVMLAGWRPICRARTCPFISFISTGSDSLVDYRFNQKSACHLNLGHQSRLASVGSGNLPRSFDERTDSRSSQGITIASLEKKDIIAELALGHLPTRQTAPQLRIRTCIVRFASATAPFGIDRLCLEAAKKTKR